MVNTGLTQRGRWPSRPQAQSYWRCATLMAGKILHAVEQPAAFPAQIRKPVP